MQHKKLLSHIVPLIVIGVTFYFFAKALIKNWHTVQDVSLAPDVFSVVSIFLFAAAVLISGVLWGSILNKLSVEKRVMTSDAIRIHCASWLLKYVPGQAGSILNKLAWGNKNGFSKKAITNSFIYENVLMVLAGATLSVPVFVVFTDALEGGISLLLPLIAIIPMLLILHQNFFYTLVNMMMKKAKRRPFSKRHFLDSHNLRKLFIGYLIPRAINGVAFIFIVHSLTSITPGMYGGLGATYILAGIVGMLAIFVPSGLGVREGIIVLFASQYVGTEQAIILAVVARLYATIADIGVFLVYLVLNKGRLQQL